MKNDNSMIRILDARSRITIPKEMRDLANIQADDIVKIIPDEGSILIRKVGIQDYIGNSEKELIDNIQNALALLNKTKRIKVAKSIIGSLERMDKHDS